MKKEISDQDKLIQLLEWAEDDDNSWFDSSFLMSLEEKTWQPWFKQFSRAQSEAINNMFIKFIK